MIMGGMARVVGTRRCAVFGADCVLGAVVGAVFGADWMRAACLDWVGRVRPECVHDASVSQASA